MPEDTLHTVYLALGANLGDRRANLAAALGSLPPAADLDRCSPIYETQPWGFKHQPAFLNMVARVLTRLSPQALLDHLKAVEIRLGRRPARRWGPRLIDMDILFYDDLVLKTSRLVIPHPRLQVRAFVLVPLADLAPSLVHPVLGRTVSELLAAVDVSGVVRYGTLD
jgi:2-amino-4-hydroxy-6-hydroxymethyldihydropteridine diphosphokinase